MFGSFSRMPSDVSGFRRSTSRAAAKPTIPAPMTATSNIVLLARARLGISPLWSWCRRGGGCRLAIRACIRIHRRRARFPDDLVDDAVLDRFLRIDEEVAIRVVGD